MADENDGVEIPRSGDVAFGALMDTLVEDAEAEAPREAPDAPSGSPEAAGADAAEADRPAAGAGETAGAAAESAAADGSGLDTNGPRDEGDSAGDAERGGDQGAGEPADAGPGDGDPAGSRAQLVDVATLQADLGSLSQKFEETTTQAFQQQALEAVQGEYTNYFDALRQHPRMLVGTEVPALNSDDGRMEVLRDASDAKDWQEAVKALLTEEIRDRAAQSMEENSDIISTVHSSIELFTKNKDLVPGTKQFNRQLADAFAAMAKPYELRVDGKLHGYTIPVQPLIDQLRTQQASQARQPQQGAAPAAAAPAKQTKPKSKADAPQAAVRSKAGSGAETEDFSTLFGTLGLPDLSR